jgi:hypothetical protein
LLASWLLQVDADRKSFKKNKNTMNIQTITKLAAAMAVVGFVASAQAYTITPNFPEVATGPNGTTPSQIAGLTDLYKSEVPSGEEGSFQNSYSTVYDNDPNDPADATITHDGPNTITNAAYLFVKDGNANPGWYLFDISGWDGTTTIVLEGFWPQQGAISHISIYGGGGNRVPDGGATVALLGVGLLGLGAIRRKLS